MGGVKSPSGVTIVPEMQSSAESWFNQAAQGRGQSQEDTAAQNPLSSILQKGGSQLLCEEIGIPQRVRERSQVTREILK